jgi:TRAP transporter T-component
MKGMRGRQLAWRWVLGWLVMGSMAGCKLNQIAVDTTAGLLTDAEDSTRAYFDYESAGYAAPSGIMQLEGLHSISPDNEGLSLTLAKAYMAYAYGWVMDARDRADLSGDFDLAKHHQQRAYLMYTRALNLVMRVARERDSELSAVLKKDPKTFTAHLKERWNDREDDVPVLFWLMMTWSSSVNNALEADALIDLPMIRAIAEYLAQLDPGYEDAGVLVFLGGVECSYPEQVGGNPKKGKQLFEQALALSHRKNHIHLVNYAQLCAVALRDRALYESVLREIIDGADQGQMHRLSNKVARRRAIRALSRADELFYE